MSRTCRDCKFKDQSATAEPCGSCSQIFPKGHSQADNWQPEQALCAFPEDDAERSKFPLFDGALAYFPNAIAYVAYISKMGSEKHNPGQPMHWARNKSTDHENKIARHLVDAGKLDSAGVRHSGNLAWRSLALLQTELEQAGLCPPSPASRFD
jgi:hypothetical protein